MWEALRTFKDDRHLAWKEAIAADTEQMWNDLEGMGVIFVNGILPSYEAKKKLAAKSKVDEKAISGSTASQDISMLSQGNPQLSHCPPKAHGQASLMVSR